MFKPHFVILVLASAAVGAVADDWPQFRGPNRDGISAETGLLTQWPEEGPRVLWSRPMCEGYSAAAICQGRVYFNDYDRDSSEWGVYCVSLEDGEPLWDFKHRRRIRPNHGITRTVPAVDERFVFSLDPKCVLHCLDAATGQERWSKSLVKTYKAKIPAWYNGQCPLIDDGKVVVATGGEALVVALDQATGEEIWRTPNPSQALMSHASLMPAVLGGVKQYLYCTLQGPVGVAAEDGRLLWSYPWKFNVAVAPSPLVVGDDQVFLTAGYQAGCLMIRVSKGDDGTFTVEEVFDLNATVWNSEVHTPIVFQDHLFAVGRKRRGLLTCLNLSGELVWTSTGEASFELGSFMLADGMLFILEGKTGMLRLIEASTDRYVELDHAQVLSGHDVWAPMALSNGRLILRDMTKMVCIEVAKGAGGAPAGPQASVPPVE